MKFVEQQLIALLTETPQETECSVSIVVLEGFGLKGREIQSIWLNTYRPSKEGKSWRCLGERWEYTTSPKSPVQTRQPFSSPTTTPWRTSQATPERLLPPIVVKPLMPLENSK